MKTNLLPIMQKRGDNMDNLTHAKSSLIVLLVAILTISCINLRVSYAILTQPPQDTIPLHTYYVATNGDDTSPGTLDKPFKSWSKAWSVVVAGDLVYVRGGVYYPDPNKYCSIILAGKNGEPGKYIRFFAYPGETPVLDCSNISYVGELRGVKFKGDYCYFKGLEIRGIPQFQSPLTGKGFFCVGFSAYDCNNNVFENLNIHNNGCSGFMLTGNSNNNLLLNSDFHHNYDPYTYSSDEKPYPGGNADGVGMGSIPKDCSNIVSGCRFWWNSDDGIDLYGCEGVVIIKNCWSFWNGYQPGSYISAGDGVGFKLGKTVEPNDNTPKRIITNCIAYANRTTGFSQNSGSAMMVLYNNTAYKNHKFGYWFQDYPLKHIIKNNISYSNNNGVYPECYISKESDQTNNSWNGFIITDADFVSVDSLGIDGKRIVGNILPNINFLKLAQTSGLIARGVNVGLPFSGETPDIGAWQSTYFNLRIKQ